jgi:DNA/RNA-binding domain of Phe-tRNA-synthetase-like protein
MESENPETGASFQIEVEAHPLLRPTAFTTQFPRPLGEMPSPSWLIDTLALEADVPIHRDGELRLAVRNMLRHWGHKPAGRGKPASEYLVRAIGEGVLDSINVAVDICNAVSLHSGFPIAMVDLDRARPPFRVSPGLPEETYVFNASGQEMSLKGLVCLRDAEGPCANPVKDAQRTKTDESTTRTLTVIWGVLGFEGQLDTAVEWYQEMLERVGSEVSALEVRFSEAEAREG